jgi:hypothetical protein
MKKLSIVTFLALGSIILSATPVLADGSSTYREIKSNSILECPTQRHIEKYHRYSGGPYSSGSHVILCLENNSQAKWIIESSVQCINRNEINRDENYCPSTDFNRSEPSKNTYIFNPTKTLIGTNCSMVRKKRFDSYDWVWSCKKYTRENLTIMTKGNGGMESIMQNGRGYKFYENFRKKYEFSVPACPKDGNCTSPYPNLSYAIGIPDRRTFLECGGNTKDCNEHYDFKY